MVDSVESLPPALSPERLHNTPVFGGLIHMSIQNLTGSCLCGEVRVTLTGDPVAVAVCHCTHCQKTAGSAFSIVLLVPEAAVTVEGSVSGYGDRGDSGLAVTRNFCSTCGSPVETSSEATRGQHVRIVKAGLFAGVREFTPKMELFCSSRSTWVPALPGTATFAGMPSQ
jgi:hypothetical protein